MTSALLSPEVLVGGGGSLAVGVAGSVLAWRMGWWHALLGLFTRIGPDRLGRHPTRRAVLAALAERRVLTTPELQRRTEANYGTLKHHLRLLADAGRVRSVRDGRSRLWYRTDGPPPAAASGAPLRGHPHRRRILATVSERPGLPQSALARSLNLPRSSVQRNLAVLASHRLVELRRDRVKVRCYPGPPQGAAAAEKPPHGPPLKNKA